MKTDLQIQKDVVDELHWDPSVSHSEIAVAAKNGVVTLSGTVRTFAEKYAAERAAQRVSGVKAIAEDLAVRITPGLERSDAEIAHAAVSALTWDVEVPNDRLKVTVEDGFVTLTGEAEWKYQKDAAERAVRYLTGVKGVVNLIAVKPKPVSTFDVGTRIKDAFRRNAERDADRITVRALDGKVTLTGNVRSYTERGEAERAAWSAPGVTSVDDRIAIG
jgi:osmotically-inducible protein OsmY